MILSVALALLTGQGKTITVTFPPTPVAKAVDLLSKTTDIRLAVAPALTDEVILARLKDAPVEATLQHLAESLCAKWVSRDEGIRWLEPDPKLLHKVEEEKALVEKNHYVNAQQQLLSELAKQPPDWDQKRINTYRELKTKEESEWKLKYTDTDDMIRMEPKESPLWRALVLIDSQLDPKELVDMPEGERQVWAEEPTAIQRQFSSYSKQVLQTLRHEVELVAPNQTIRRIKFELHKLIPLAINTTLTAYFANGNSFEFTSVWLQDITSSNLPPTSAQVSSPPEGDPFLQIPPDALEIRKALSSSYSGKDRAQLFEKWRNRFVNPVKYEPLQWHHGLDLVLAAEEKNKQLIGTINDFTDSHFWSIEPLRASQVLQQEEDQFVKTSDGWLVLRGNLHSDRPSRFKARDLIQQSLVAGGVTVDAAAEWTSHAAFRFPFLTWVGNYLGELLTNSGPYGTFAGIMNDIDLLFWARLGSQSHAALRRGETLRLTLLPEPARQQLARMVFWQSRLGNSRIEPTDIWPTGRFDGEMKLSVTEKPLLIGWSSVTGSTVTKRPLDAESFGRLLAEGDVNLNANPPSVFRQYDRFRIGVCHAYSLGITLQPGSVPLTLEYLETLFPPENGVVQTLPASFQAAVEKARLDALAHPTKVNAPNVIHP